MVYIYRNSYICIIIKNNNNIIRQTFYFVNNHIATDW